MFLNKFLSVVLLSGVLSSCSSKKVENFLGEIRKTKRPESKIFNVLWNKNVAPSYETGNLPVVFNSPLIHDGYLYVGDNKGKFKAFDISSRRLLWDKFDGGQYYGKPIIVDGAIIYGTSEGRVFSRNINTGLLNFEVMVGDSVESGISYRSGRIFFQLRNHQVFCLDASTGKTLWSYKKSIAQGTTVHSTGTPVVADDYVLVGFADGTLGSFRLETGELRWETSISSASKFNDVDIPPIVLGQSVLVYSEGGQLVELDLKSGQVKNRLNYYPSSEISLIDGKFFFGDAHGSLYILNSDFTLLKKMEQLVQGKVRFIRSWKNGILILSLNGRASYISLNKSNNALNNLELSQEKFNLGTKYSLFLSSPEVKNNYLALTSSLGRLVLFR